MGSREFSFHGEIPSSKSVYIRCLLATTYASGLEIEGSSCCDDVLVMREAVTALENRSLGELCVIPCGEAGLVFRLMLGRVSRLKGEFQLTGSERLLGRPHDPLFSVLRELGVEITHQGHSVHVSSRGWRKPSKRLTLERSTSSQYASSLVLNAWELDFPLEIRWEGHEVSSGYFAISQQMAKQMGMQIETPTDGIVIPAGQKIRCARFRAELDYSSAFAIAALAAVAGEAVIVNADPGTLQPDSAFEGILQTMGVHLKRDGLEIRIRKPRDLNPIVANLSDSPDLFPVLSVLCALSQGRSELMGAPHLVHKESDRIQQTARLLELCGRSVQRNGDGLSIEGRSGARDVSAFDFDPQGDHRLVMAAAVARWAGIPVRILKSHSVSKSFPEFVRIAETDHT